MENIFVIRFRTDGRGRRGAATQRQTINLASIGCGFNSLEGMKYYSFPRSCMCSSKIEQCVGVWYKVSYH